MNRVLTLAALSGAIAVTACASTGGTAAAQSKPGVWLAQGSEYTVTVKDDISFNFFGQDTKQVSTVTMGLEALYGGDAQRWRWSYADMSIQEMDMPEDGIDGISLEQIGPLVSPLIRLMTVPGFECKVDINGGCAELTNWRQWRGAFEDTILFGERILGVAQAVQKASGGEAASEFPVDQRAVDMVVNIGLNLLDGVDSKSAGPMAISGVVGPTMIQGANFSDAGPMNFTRSVPLPFGGGALVLNGKRTVESVDRKAGSALVTATAELDGKAFLTSISTMIDTLVTPNMKVYATYDPEGGAAAMGMVGVFRDQLNQTLAKSNLTYTMTTRGTVELSTGLARESVTEYKLAFKGGGDFDWLEGSASGSQTVTITDGAPQIVRLTRREIGPPPPKAEVKPQVAPSPPAPPAPMKLAPRRQNRH